MTGRRHTAIDHAVAAIDDIDLAALAHGLHLAVEVDRRNPTDPDGYPTQTHGASAIPRLVPAPPVGPCAEPGCGVERPCPDHDTPVDLTSVEAAVARGKLRDDFARHITAAEEYFADAARALRAARHRLDAARKLQDDAGLKPAEEGCQALERVGSFEPALHAVIVDGVSWRLGSWAYKFQRRTGRVPSLDECRRHARGQKVYTKAS